MGNRECKFVAVLADSLVEMAKDISAIGVGGDLRAIANSSLTWEPEFTPQACRLRAIEFARELNSLPQQHCLELEFELYEVMHSLGGSLQRASHSTVLAYKGLIKELRRAHVSAYVLFSLKRVVQTRDEQLFINSELGNIMSALLDTPPAKRTSSWLEVVARITEIRWARMLDDAKYDLQRENEVSSLLEDVKQLAPGARGMSEAFTDTITILNLHRGDLLNRRKMALLPVLKGGISCTS